MVVQNKRLEKACCFYVSEFHLEMILVPYIDKKIEENITILTEKNLKPTINILVSKMNLNNKEKILQLGWDGDKEIKENSHVIVVGSKEFIKEKNEEVRSKNTISVLDCYDFEDEKYNMERIIKEYEKTLNTLGKNNF